MLGTHALICRTESCSSLDTGLDNSCGHCQAGLSSTEHLLTCPAPHHCRQIYTKRKGPNHRHFPNGAILGSNVVDSIPQGYGTMTWPNDDTYMVRGRRGEAHVSKFGSVWIILIFVCMYGMAQG
jgi:hypothetical protein